MKDVLIDEVPKFLALIPSETMHAIQIENLFDATHSIVIPLKLNRVASSFKVRIPTGEEYEDQNILKIKLTTKAHHGICLALNIVIRSRVCLTTGDGLSALTLKRGDNHSSILSHCMLMMMQMLWMTTILPQC